MRRLVGCSPACRIAACHVAELQPIHPRPFTGQATAACQTRSTTSARTRNLLTVAFIVVCTALYLALRQVEQRD